jgi:APA family basic amino acid/polyamine antiporter
MTTGTLARRLGTGDAVVVGLGAMLGAGVFAAFGPAAQAARSWLLASLGIAAVVAFCNAVASAQLAAVHPSSGGSYVFGRAVLGPWWGFVAGWGFVVGKTASCAAMAMTFAAYAVPDRPGLQRALAVAAVVALTALNLRGITRTAQVARLLLAVCLVVLAGFVVVALVGEPSAPVPPLGAAGGTAGPLGVLQGAGILFFAFAGYARIATLAEEVRRPEVIGRAILIAFTVAVAVYLAVGWALVDVLGGDLAGSRTPLAAGVHAVGADWAGPAVRVGAAVASLGALLALITGISRTMLAMARERDLPPALAVVDERHRVPARAQLAVGLAVTVLLLVADLRGAIGFSSFGVLTYYFVANASALRQPEEQRRWPRVLQVLGLAGCATLALSLPAFSVVVGTLVLLAGVGLRVLLRREAAPAG